MGIDTGLWMTQTEIFIETALPKLREFCIATRKHEALGATSHVYRSGQSQRQWVRPRQVYWESAFEDTSELALNSRAAIAASQGFEGVISMRKSAEVVPTDCSGGVRAPFPNINMVGLPKRYQRFSLTSSYNETKY